MPKKVSIIDQIFAIDGIGTVICLPDEGWCLPKAENIYRHELIQIRTPSGKSIPTFIKDIEMINRGRDRGGIAFSLPHSIAPSDIPAGSELWLERDGDEPLINSQARFESIKEMWLFLRKTPFPEELAGEEIDGECLVSLDSALAGHITTFLAGAGASVLNAGDLRSLRENIKTLARVLLLLPQEHRPYFDRLHQIAQAVLSWMSAAYPHESTKV